MKRRGFIARIAAGLAGASFLPGVVARATKAEIAPPEVSEMLLLEDLGSNLYVKLHTEYPGHEACAVPRDSKYWRVEYRENEGSWATNAQEIRFPECTGGNCIVTQVGIFDGKGNLIHQMGLDRHLLVEKGVTPIFPAGALKLMA